MNTKAAEAVREAAERITLAQVQEACAKNGFAKPLRWTWAACPIGQVARANDASDHYEWAIATYGNDYVLGFYAAFDYGPATGVGERVKAGIEDGQKIREAYYPTRARYSFT
jgi:hypothetical protein